MMKSLFRKTILLVSLLLTATVTSAQLANNQRLLGYTITDKIDVDGAAFGEAGTYVIGAALAPEDLTHYKGCRVVGLRVAVAMNLGRTRTFLYNFSGTSFDTLVEQKQRLYQGWNNIFFNGEGYEITGEETLFFGYDYTETDEMVAAEQGGMCCVGNDTEGAFYLYGDYGQGVGLYSITGAGKLCVQLIVDVSSLPRYDLRITTLDTGFKYKQPGENVEVMATLGNVGRDTIFHCQLGWQLDEQEPVYINLSDTILSGQRETWLGMVPLSADIATGLHTLRFFINEIEGVSPLSPVTSHQSTSFAIYRQTLPRDEVYMEVYTDQDSPYSAMLNSSISEMLKTSGQVSVVNVHRAGTTLAVDDATYLHDLYAYTWPSFTVNRAYFPGEAYIAYDMNDYLMLPLYLTAGILSDIVMQDLFSPAFASVALQGSYDADSRQLTVEARGQLLPEAELFYGKMALTLMLVEDGVKGAQAVYNATTGRTSMSQNYVHNHVLRGYMTAPIGTPLDAVDGEFMASFTTTLNQTWNADRLKVVALLTKAVDAVTDDNLLDMDVVNANSLTVEDIIMAQGIENADCHQSPVNSHLSTVHSLDGKPVRVGKMGHGLYIERCANGTTRKITK